MHDYIEIINTQMPRPKRPARPGWLIRIQHAGQTGDDPAPASRNGNAPTEHHHTLQPYPKRHPGKPQQVQGGKHQRQQPRTHQWDNPPCCHKTRQRVILHPKGQIISIPRNLEESKTQNHQQGKLPSAAQETLRRVGQAKPPRDLAYQQPQDQAASNAKVSTAASYNGPQLKGGANSRSSLNVHDRGNVHFQNR